IPPAEMIDGRQLFGFRSLQGTGQDTFLTRCCAGVLRALRGFFILSAFRASISALRSAFNRLI
ncbi:hypothetical protein, partial [Alistipes shahii]|uniref:hypothetical protein n=1 Tax=Alistipes shahii TaxID=328814 RepID=UPI0034A490CC